MDERRILIIEDEQKIADTVKFGLSEHGYIVDVAYDGEIGKRIFDAHRFNVVILDVNLPGMNGYELCKYIRTRDAAVVVVMLTSMNTLEDKVEGYDSGADDYIIKPFEFKELLLKIRVLLKRTMDQQLPTGSILRAGDLVFNLERMEVRRDNKPISLTAKELQLLEYLLRNKNKVVSRADIAINVWDMSFDSGSNVIDVYINYLRNKIDRPFKEKLIQTQVGIGYILKENQI